MLALHLPIFCLLARIALTGVVAGEKKEDSHPCIRRDYGRGSFVCVCNSTYCDTSPPLRILPRTTEGNGIEVQIFTSSKNGHRLHKSTSAFSRPRIYNGKTSTGRTSPSAQPVSTTGNIFDFFRRIGLRSSRPIRRIDGNEEVSILRVVDRERFQEVIGVGGSFTDSAGGTIRKLSFAAQENLMKSYFSPDESNYSLGRVPIGGTDFSSRPYTYDDTPKNIPDVNLTDFSLQPEDIRFKIPIIKWAEALRGEKLRLVASPWSAPVWMKTNQRLNGAGVLRREFYQVWADYFVKFIEAYKKAGISIWGVTTGNEPLNGFLPAFPFNCMGWRPAEASKWIGDHLGPTLRRKFPDEKIKVIMMDDNKVFLSLWSKVVLDTNRTSARYVDGVGTHWYLNFLSRDDALSRFHAEYPNQLILSTEACLGFVPWALEKVSPGNWERGESYLEAIINDMRNWVGGWIDWNLALDMDGGPNWAGWRADAAILVDGTKDEFLKQPIFYAISHVSRFVPPGSTRIGLSQENVPSTIQTVAFQRPADNGTVLVLLNKSLESLKLLVEDERRGSMVLEIPGKSMQTVVYW